MWLRIECLEGGEQLIGFVASKVEMVSLQTLDDIRKLRKGSARGSLVGGEREWSELQGGGSTSPGGAPSMNAETAAAELIAMVYDASPWQGSPKGLCPTSIHGNRGNIVVESRHYQDVGSRISVKGLRKLR